MPGRSRKPVQNRGVLAQVVADAVGKLALRAEDAAAAALAVRYAETIDNAAELAEAAALIAYDPDTAAQVARLAVRVQAHTVMADVGPKLLAALAALMATPAARANVKGATPPPPGVDQLAALRAGRLA